MPTTLPPCPLCHGSGSIPEMKNQLCIDPRTGQRVIENTIREKLPEGFQRAEYLLDHGMIDMVVHRKDLPETLGRLIGYLAPEKAA